MEADFSGYATKNGLKCADGRTIMPGAFKDGDGQRVPLVWQHQHNETSNILGHGILENRNDGVYVYGFFNDSQSAAEAKESVKHGDITALSIYANKLVHQGDNVVHGAIREVSLVIAGANPGAFIDYVSLTHGDSEETLDTEAIIYTDESLAHAEGDDEGDDAGNDEETIGEIYETLDEKQKSVVNYLIAAAAGEGGDEDDSDDDDADNTLDHSENTSDTDIHHAQEGRIMTANVFEKNGEAAGTKHRATLTHDQLTSIVEDGKKLGSLKESFLAHAVEYGIENIDFLFPDAKALSNTPEFIKRRTEWVDKVLRGTNHSPFSRIKTLSADITHDEARAKGYVKGTLKKEEWFKLAKRVTTPTTIYKKQKLDRDDIIDITTIDVVVWLKAEMRLMLDEEIARAILIGDGREVDDTDKIDEEHIRPIAREDDFYAHKFTLAANVSAQDAVEAILRQRPNLKGSGTPTMFTTEGFLIDLLLSKDKMGRRLYNSEEELARVLRVAAIVPVEVMETQTDLLAILVNLNDYTVGADQGGSIAMFDDFDIDYNQYKYLIETRISGALTKFKSALVIRRAAGTLVTPAVPTFVPATGVVTIPAVTGVIYKNADTGTTLTAGAQSALAAGATIEVEAVPAANYFFPHNFDADWEFTRPV